MSELKRKSQDQLKKESRERMNERRLNESPEETQKRQKYDALYVSSFSFCVSSKRNIFHNEHSLVKE